MSEIRTQTKKLSSNKSNVPNQKPPLKPELSTRELLMNQIRNNPKVLKANEPVALSPISNKSPRPFLPAQNNNNNNTKTHTPSPMTPPATTNFNLSQPGLYSAKTFQAQNNNNNSGEGRCDLLADIRKGIKLRNVSEASN